MNKKILYITLTVFFGLFVLLTIFFLFPNKEKTKPKNEGILNENSKKELINFQKNSNCEIPNRDGYGFECTELSLDECEKNNLCQIWQYGVPVCEPKVKDHDRITLNYERKIGYDDAGAKVDYGSIFVSVNTGYFNMREADYLACLVNGKVVGKVFLIDSYQILVNAKNPDEIQAIGKSLEAEPSVDFVWYDIELSEF